MGKRSWYKPVLILTGLVVAILGGAYALMRKSYPQFFADPTVYSVAYEKPLGWKEMPPGPMTLFVYRHPEGKGTMRASVNEVQASYNPTPELDTDGIAEHFVSVTEENLPEWTAERREPISSGSETFSLIKRSKKDKTVYTAFCSKGNTTVVVSLYAGGSAASHLDDLMPDFRKLLASFKLTPKAIHFED